MIAQSIALFTCTRAHVHYTYTCTHMLTHTPTHTHTHTHTLHTCSSCKWYFWALWCVQFPPLSQFCWRKTSSCWRFSASLRRGALGLTSVGEADEQDSGKKHFSFSHDQIKYSAGTNVLMQRLWSSWSSMLKKHAPSPLKGSPGVFPTPQRKIWISESTYAGYPHLS